jgi:DNA-binding Lrp family transcriptional regulator
MIQVINRAFDIMEYIARDAKKEYALSEIADALKLNHATCANILKTMVERNYLEQAGYKKGYRLGHMMQQITGNNSYEQELLAASIEEMEKMTSRMNETSLLAILRKDIRIALHQVNAKAPREDFLSPCLTIKSWKIFWPGMVCHRLISGRRAQPIEHSRAKYKRSGKPVMLCRLPKRTLLELLPPFIKKKRMLRA